MSELINIENLIEIEKAQVIDVFSDTKKLQPYIDLIKKEAHADNVSVQTAKSRKEIGSRAHKVSKIKTALEKVGKDSIADLKARVASVNAGVKFLTTELADLRTSIREPLTAWETEQAEKEQRRIDAIKEQINGIHSIGRLTGNESIEDLGNLIDAVDNIDPSSGFDEFTHEALKAINETKNTISNRIQYLIQEKHDQEAREKLEAERAEIERQREELAKAQAELAAMKAEKEIQEIADHELTCAREFASTAPLESLPEPTKAKRRPTPLMLDIAAWGESKGLAKSDLTELKLILENHGYKLTTEAA